MHIDRSGERCIASEVYGVPQGLLEDMLHTISQHLKQNELLINASMCAVSMQALLRTQACTDW